MKEEILNLLRGKPDFFSGQVICANLGVTRAAVWKVIKQLRADGYEIEAVSRKGYRLVSENDILSKGLIGESLRTEWAGREIDFREATGSTNADVKALAAAGAPHGTLVVADTQSEGRGRRGNTWISGKGTAVSMSLLLRPPIQPGKAPMLTLVMALAVNRAIKGIFLENDIQLVSLIKWPNDIVLEGRKVSGILTEMSVVMEEIDYVVIGVGINANQAGMPEGLAGVATSLRADTGVFFRRTELIGRVLEEFEQLYESFLEQGNLSFLMDEYNGSLVNQGKEVRVTDPEGGFTGVAKGINPNGELIVSLPGGGETTVFAGEVSVRGILGYV